MCNDVIMKVLCSVMFLVDYNYLNCFLLCARPDSVQEVANHSRLKTIP